MTIKRCPKCHFHAVLSRIATTSQSSYLCLRCFYTWQEQYEFPTAFTTDDPYDQKFQMTVTIDDRF